ncbi:hypothetical protein B566_EDAN002975 [Ephemera danica]|nr:hypothetical protein B566_EDAN002975 [Ephemera danica]
MSGTVDAVCNDNQNSVDGNTCLELALEGERLCKAGDCRAGVTFFEAAIQAGTNDLRTLSAIYSQLGNAYFYLGDYGKAMQYHKHDLTLARTMGDKLGEAKASGNLGNTLKVMGKFDEATICCRRHLDISRDLGDKVGEGRALYNLGNVFHAKGKHIGRLGQQDPGEFPEEVRNCLEEAVSFYEQNLKLMRDLTDTAAQGRACGNLGNTHYLLGNFSQSINYHEEACSFLFSPWHRLKIAREFGDKAAERRAHSNLGNAHIFLGEFDTAAEHYNLGNTYTLLRDYPTAIDYHLRHLKIAQELVDRMGEGRACWSLGNAHSAMGNHEKALYFASKHLEISKQIGDQLGQATAQMNVTDLRKVLGLPTGDEENNQEQPSASNNHRVRRQSMEQLDLIKMTPDARSKVHAGAIGGHAASTVQSSPAVQAAEDEDTFFDLLSRFQSKRMDDQRCSLGVIENKENTNNNRFKPSSSIMNNHLPSKQQASGSVAANGEVARDELLDLIAGMQSKRMDEQRVELPHLPGLVPPPGQRLSVATEASGPDDNFLDMLMRSQSARLEDQRSPLPEEGDSLVPNEEQEAGGPASRARGGPTVPDEDFFSLIMRLQSSGRMEDQRASVPKATRKDKKK